MFKSLLNLGSKLQYNSLANIQQCGIAYRYIPKRSPFDKTNYIDNYVPRPTKYHASRKPRLPHWDDPNISWPPIVPRPTKLRFKELIRQIENKEKHKIEKLRDFTIPDFRPGDVIEFKYLHSLSEKRGNEYIGICLGRTRRNTYNATFRVLFRFCGVKVEMNIKQFSPMLADFRLVSRGSGNLRSKLYYLSKLNLTKEQLMRPIIKRSIKKRKGDVIETEKEHKDNFTQYRLDINKDPIIEGKIQFGCI